jgi:hypothetical protein
MKKDSSKKSLQNFAKNVLTKKQKSKLKGGTDIVTSDIILE